MPHLEGLHLGHYTLLERIGRGGMSDVYRARPDDGEAEIAIKVLEVNPDDAENQVFLERFKREASIIAELDHPHILKILDFNQEGDYVYFAMPLIAGGTLVDVIKAGVSTPEAVCHWLKQIASALDHAHKLEVVHRDLKPANVLLDDEGNAFLTDFGIALLTTHTSNLTQTGIVIGTPAYMAPEQWRDEVLDGRADVYGLAVVVYLLLTMHTPFENEATHTMMYAHLNDAPPSLRQFRPQLSEAIDQVVLKALSKEREERYPSAGAFAADFLRAVENPAPELSSNEVATAPTPQSGSTKDIAIPPVEAPPDRKTYPIPNQVHQALVKRSVRRTRWLMLLGGLVSLVMVGAVLGVLALSSGSNEETKPTAIPSLTFTPAPTTTPNLRPANPPKVRIWNLQDGDVFALGQEVVIQLEAFDPEGGITRVELRRFGEVLQAYDVPSDTPDPTRVSVQFYYEPPTVGDYSLEVIPYRGELAGDSDVIRIVVQ